MNNARGTVLLTGAAGFFGSRLVIDLLSRGFEVHAFHRQQTSLRRLQEHSDRVFWHDSSDVKVPFTRRRIDAVIHCATCYGRRGESPSEIAATNMLYPLEVLEAAIQGGCPLFVNVDTYYNKHGIVYSYLPDYCVSKRQFLDRGPLPRGSRAIH